MSDPHTFPLPLKADGTLPPVHAWWEGAFPFPASQYAGGCNCAFRTPTVPTCRDPRTHLDDCPAKGSGYVVGQIVVRDPSDITLRQVQSLNRQRADRWHQGDFREWSGLEWAGAMCGEAGEAANVAKKLRRVEHGLNGNEFSEHRIAERELVDKLAKELADTFLYLCLLASRYEIDLERAVTKVFNEKSKEMGFPERLVREW